MEFYLRAQVHIFADLWDYVETAIAGSWLLGVYV